MTTVDIGSGVAAVAGCPKTVVVGLPDKLLLHGLPTPFLRFLLLWRLIPMAINFPFSLVQVLEPWLQTKFSEDVFLLLETMSVFKPKPTAAPPLPVLSCLTTDGSSKRTSKLPLSYPLEPQSPSLSGKWNSLELPLVVPQLRLLRVPMLQLV